MIIFLLVLVIVAIVLIAIIRSQSIQDNSLDVRRTDWPQQDLHTPTPISEPGVLYSITQDSRSDSDSISYHSKLSSYATEHSGDSNAIDSSFEPAGGGWDSGTSGDTAGGSNFGSSGGGGDFDGSGAGGGWSDNSS